MDNDLNFIEDADDPSDENLDDVQVGGSSLAGAVVYNTDWTVETIANQVAKGRIDLTPSFQRRDAWTVQKKSLLIESILLNFPVPPLTLAENGISKTYLVVDGKQRLTAISQYFGLMEGATNNKFKLSGLQELRDINGQNIDGLRESFPQYNTALENYSIRTNVIRGWRRDDVLYSIFLRLNSGSVKLSPQELRQALKPGPFSDFMSDYTQTSEALRAIFPGVEPDFRMRDLELMLRYIGFQFFVDEYRGNLKKFLDFTAQTLNAEWPKYNSVIVQKCAIFESAYKAVVEVFSEDRAFRKWTGSKWESRLNRAVFDVMMFYLRDAGEIGAFKATGVALVAEFQNLCSTNPQFRDAIETTTKSVDAVSWRLGLWGGVLVKFGIIKNEISVTADRVISYEKP
ncbi:DUF262 domain-containing protein [Methylobacterium hispanicum]|uniref:DUF262 domain-containing protein n=1 Tax=Methylobacterium hispanicum TaxID=270350 RepID=UPI002F34F1DF